MASGHFLLSYKFFDVPPLGTGGYAVVRLASWKHPSEESIRSGLVGPDGKVAVKVVSKAAVKNRREYLRLLVGAVVRLRRLGQDAFDMNPGEGIMKLLASSELDVPALIKENEAWIQSAADAHPHICPLLDWFESTNSYYVIFPLLSGGELLQKILERKRFTEDEARLCLKNIISTLAFIHAQGIIHRDIKAENFLYSSSDSAIDDFQLIDFGISKILEGTPTVEDRFDCHEVSGTPGYAAPEIFLRTGYGKNSDCFSAGVVGYAMMCGSSPWDSIDPWELVQETASHRTVNFRGRRFEHISEEAKEYVSWLMTPDPRQRPSSEEALRHPWLNTPCGPCSRPPTRPSSPSSDEPEEGPAAFPLADDHPIEVLRRQETLKPMEESNLMRRITTRTIPISPNRAS